MTNRDIADAIDKLCRLRANQSRGSMEAINWHKRQDADAEALIRAITDGFTERDPRRGVITSGKPGFS